LDTIFNPIKEVQYYLTSANYIDGRIYRAWLPSDQLTKVVIRTDSRVFSHSAEKYSIAYYPGGIFAHGLTK